MAGELQGLDVPRQESPEFVATIQAVRLFLRDYAELNLLIRGEESTDRMIAWAVLDFLSDFNGTPPFTTYSVKDLFDRQLQNLIVRGTVISLLHSVGFLHTRNHLPFSDGGLSVQIYDKAPMLQQWIHMLEASYEQKKRLVKTALNIASMMDTGPTGLHSDYLQLFTIGQV